MCTRHSDDSIFFLFCRQATVLRLEFIPDLSHFRDIQTLLSVVHYSSEFLSRHHFVDRRPVDAKSFGGDTVRHITGVIRLFI
jgi:hypothetical protein